MSSLRIDAVNAHLLSWPLKEPLEFSFGAKRERTTALVEVRAGGLTGWGEANWGGIVAGGKALLSLVDERARPALLGRDAFETEALWRGLDSLGSDGNRVAVAGAVDMALHDLVGQATGRPIFDLLGGSWRSEIPVYGSALMIEPLADLARQARKLVARGFAGVKMRIGRVAAQDPERVACVRRAVGPGVKLFVDANGHYNRAEALRVGRALEELDVEHFEEPLPKWDVEGCAALARQLRLPIAAGECTSLRVIKDYLAAGAAQVIQPDVTVNGFTETRKILALAEAYRAEVVLHNFEGGVGLAGMLHVAASSPLTRQLQELDCNPNPFQTEILKEPLRPVKGAIAVPRRPGLGVSVDRAALKKYLLASV